MKAGGQGQVPAGTRPGPVRLLRAERADHAADIAELGIERAGSSGGHVAAVAHRSGGKGLVIHLTAPGAGPSRRGSVDGPSCALGFIGHSGGIVAGRSGKRTGSAPRRPVQHHAPARILGTVVQPEVVDHAGHAPIVGRCNRTELGVQFHIRREVAAVAGAVGRLVLRVIQRELAYGVAGIGRGPGDRSGIGEGCATFHVANLASEYAGCRRHAVLVLLTHQP